jgi:hypothetical protein
MIRTSLSGEEALRFGHASYLLYEQPLVLPQFSHR